MGLCFGSYKTFYKNKFSRSSDEIISGNKGSCSKCEEIARRFSNSNCDKDDSRCIEQSQLQVTHKCLSKYCKDYKNMHNKTKGYYKKIARYFSEKIQLVFGRMKVHQRLRNQYDNKIENRVRMMAFRDTRDSILKSIQLEEDNLYDYQNELFETNDRKNEKFEKEFMQKVEELINEPEQYEEYIDTEYAIFEDI